MKRAKTYLYFGLSVLLVLSACSQNQIVDQTHLKSVISIAINEYELAGFTPLIESYQETNADMDVRLTSPIEYTGQENYLSDYISNADILFTYNGEGVNYATYFMDLGPIITTDDSLIPDLFWEGSLSACQDNTGKIYGLPVSTLIHGLFYKKSAISVFDIPNDLEDWTIPSFTAILDHLSQDPTLNNKTLFIDQSGLMLNIYLEEVLFNNNGNYTAAEIKESFQWYFDLAERGIISAFASENTSVSLLDGEALFISSSNPVEFMEDNQSEVWGFLPFPKLSMESSFGNSLANTTCLSISAASSHPLAAWDLIKYLFTNLDKNYFVIKQGVFPIDKQGFENHMDLYSIPDRDREMISYTLDHAVYQVFFRNERQYLLSAMDKWISENKELDHTFLENKATNDVIPPFNPTEIVQVLEPTPEALAEEEKIVIHYYSRAFLDSDIIEFQQIVDKFNETVPGIHVEWTYSINDSLVNDYMTYLSDNFDCFSSMGFGSGKLPPDIGDKVKDLTPLIEQESHDFQNDFYLGQRNLLQRDHQQFGLPGQSEFRMIAYNKTLLDNLGLPVPSVDATFEDYLNLLIEGVSRSDVEIYGYVDEQGDDYLLTGLGFPNYLSTNFPEKPHMDVNQAVSTLLRFKDVYTQANFVLYDGQNMQQIQSLITNKKILSWPTFSGSSGGFYQAEDEFPFDIGFLPMSLNPSISQAENEMNLQGHFISVNTFKDQACWTWIKYLTEQSDQIYGVPSRKSVLYSQDYQDQVGPELVSLFRNYLSTYTKPQAEREQENLALYGPITYRISSIKYAVLNGLDPNIIISQAQYEIDLFWDCVIVNDFYKMSEEEIRSVVDGCLTW